MPTFKRKTSDGSTNDWYVLKYTDDISKQSPPVSTFQIADEGRDMLLDIGLNHSSEPDRKAEIDDDVYYLLNDLGYLSKKGDGMEPGDALSGSYEFTRLEELSDPQRFRLAQSILDRFSLRELCEHEQVLEFIVALDTIEYGTGDEIYQMRMALLTRILSNTPFAPETVNELPLDIELYSDFNWYDDDETFYNTIVVAIIVHFLYEVWETNGMYSAVLSGEGESVWVWDGWVAFAGDELMYYANLDETTDALPEPIQAALPTQTRHCDIHLLFDFLRNEFAVLSMAQTVINVEATGGFALSRLVQAGFKGLDEVALILPRHPSAGAPLPEEALKEARQSPFQTQMKATLGKHRVE